jgi:hypothetical protein
MHYMMLIYTQEREAAQQSPDEMEKVRNGHVAAMKEARGLGILHSAAPLKPTATATTVRMQDGKAITMDGPFAETKEQLAGFYILDCKDLDEAIEWASKIPTGCGGGNGCIEVRPIACFPDI